MHDDGFFPAFGIEAGFVPSGRFEAGVVRFPLVEIGGADGAVFGGFPRGVGRDDRPRSVGEFHFELRQERRRRAELVAVPDHEVSGVPALAEERAEGVVALAQERRHVPRDELDVLAVVGPARREEVLGGGLAVHGHGDEPERRGVEARLHGRGGEPEFLSEHRHGKSFARARLPDADPLRPDLPFAERADLEEGGFAPRRRGAVLVPSHHPPEDGVAGAERPSRVFDVERFGRFDAAGVPEVVVSGGEVFGGRRRDESERGLSRVEARVFDLPRKARGPGFDSERVREKFAHEADGAAGGRGARLHGLLGGWHLGSVHGFRDFGFSETGAALYAIARRIGGRAGRTAPARREERPSGFPARPRRGRRPPRACVRATRSSC